MLRLNSIKSTCYPKHTHTHNGDRKKFYQRMHLVLSRITKLSKRNHAGPKKKKKSVCSRGYYVRTFLSLSTRIYVRSTWRTLALGLASMKKEPRPYLSAGLRAEFQMRERERERPWACLPPGVHFLFWHS